MGRLLGCWCVAVQVAAALLPAPSPRACGALRRAAVADVTDGFLSPQQIKTLRKEIDGRRKRKSESADAPPALGTAGAAAK